MITEAHVGEPYQEYPFCRVCGKKMLPYLVVIDTKQILNYRCKNCKRTSDIAEVECPKNPN